MPSRTIKRDDSSILRRTEMGLECDSEQWVLFGVLAEGVYKEAGFDDAMPWGQQDSNKKTAAASEMVLEARKHLVLQTMVTDETIKRAAEWKFDNLHKREKGKAI